MHLPIVEIVLEAIPTREPHQQPMHTQPKPSSKPTGQARHTNPENPSMCLLIPASVGTPKEPAWRVCGGEWL